MFNRKLFALPMALFTVGTAFIATPAFSDGAAPHATKSDENSGIFNPTVDLPLSAGEIQQSSLPASFNTGYVFDDEGRRGGRLSLEGYKPILIFGSDEYQGQGDRLKAGVINLELGGKLTLEASKNPGTTEGTKLSRYELESPRLGLLSAHISHFPDGGGHDLETGMLTRTESPSATAGIDVISAAYRAGESTPLNFKEKDVDIEFLKLGIHGAYRLGGVNIDHCLEANGVGKVGEMSISDRKFDSMGGIRASACMGVQVGKLFNVNDRVSYSMLTTHTPDSITGVDDKGKNITHHNDSAQVVQFSNTLALKNIAQTPLYVSWMMQKELSNTGGENAERHVVNTNLLSVGVAR
jgi:hypothetical protein